MGVRINAGHALALAIGAALGMLVARAGASSEGAPRAAAEDVGAESAATRASSIDVPPSRAPADTSRRSTGTHPDAGLPRTEEPCAAPATGERIATRIHDWVTQIADGVDPSVETETAASAFYDYLDGSVGSVIASAVDLRPLAESTSNDLCASGTSAVARFLLLRVARHIALRGPGVRRGLECAIESATREDVMLWAALDAWRDGGFGESEAVERWRTAAVDERTTNRLLSNEDIRSVSLDRLHER